MVTTFLFLFSFIVGFACGLMGAGIVWLNHHEEENERDLRRQEEIRQYIEEKKKEDEREGMD